MVLHWKSIIELNVAMDLQSHSTDCLSKSMDPADFGKLATCICVVNVYPYDLGLACVGRGCCDLCVIGNALSPEEFVQIRNFRRSYLENIQNVKGVYLLNPMSLWFYSCLKCWNFMWLRGAMNLLIAPV